MEILRKKKECKWVAMLLILLVAVIMLTPIKVDAASKIYKSTKTKGDVTYSLSCNDSTYYYHKTDRCTRVTTETTWSWKKCPSTWKYNDIVAVGNAQGFTVRQFANCKNNNYCTPTNVANCKVTYYLGPNQSADNSGKYAPRTVNITVKINGSGKGVYVNIPMRKTYKINGVYCNFYAKKGTLIVNWEKQGKISPVSFASNYGHTTSYFKPSVSISGYDLKFEKHMVKGSSAYISMKKTL